MADQKIEQLRAFSPDSNIRSGDLLVVSRGGQTGKANFAGQRVLPLADSSQADYFLRVAADGTPEFRAPSAESQTRTLLWSGTSYGTPIETNALTNLNTGRRFDDYAMISMVVLLRMPSGGEGLDRWTTQTVARSQWNGYFNATAFFSDNETVQATLFVSRHDNTRFSVNVSYKAAANHTVTTEDLPRISWIYGHNHIG